MKINSKILLEFLAVCIVAITFSIPAMTIAQEAKVVEAGEMEEVGELVELEEPIQDVDDDEDDEEVVEAVAMANPFGVEPGKLLAAKKFQLTQLFAVEIEELSKVCELDKKQALKLKIATKGAVKKLTVEWAKKNNQQMGMMGGNVAVNKKADDEDDKEEVVINDADEIDDMTLQVVMMNMFGGNPYQADDPRESRFWKKTIASVLTPEQREKVKAIRADRELVKRHALTDYLVKSMAVELGMNETQTKKFDEIVRPALVSAKIDCISMYEPYVMYYYASKADKSKMKELLSSGQLQKWKIFLAPSKQIGQMIEGGGNQFGQVNRQQDFWIDIEITVTKIVEGVTSLFDGFAKKD